MIVYVESNFCLELAFQQEEEAQAEEIWQPASALQEEPEEEVAAAGVTPVLREDAEEGEEPGETAEDNSGLEQD